MAPTHAPGMPRGRRDSSAAPIDLGHLMDQALGDANLCNEVLRVYDRVQHTYYGRLRGSASLAETRANIALLRKAAAGIGAVALLGLTRAAERDLKKHAALDEERIADIGFAVEEVSAYIAGRLGQGSLLN